MNAPKVSIGLPVYNGENYLEVCIQSILNQTYRDLELIICDNASTDGTEAIIRRYAEQDERIRYYRWDRNLGAAPNFNKAFELARGEYFKWAAHDDLCGPEYLEKCVAVLDADPDVVLCHSEIEWIDSKGNPLPAQDEDLLKVGSNDPVERFRDLILTNHFCIDIFGLIRRAALGTTPLIASYIGSDRVLLAELSLHGKLTRVPDTLFFSRDHPERSVRSMSMRERAAWFNTSSSAKFVMPQWRCFIELFRAIHRVPLAGEDKLRCVQSMFPWMIKHRDVLKGDLTWHIKRMLGMTKVKTS